MEIFGQELQQLAGSVWELLAVVLSVSYLLLAMKENSWCWLCAFISTTIYMVLFWEVSLLMDSALHIYYLLMAVYGWYQWNFRPEAHQSDSLPIRRWPLQYHLYAAVIVIGASLVSGFLLEKNTQAAWPYIDSFTTWGSVLTTYMVAKKILENWLYWIVIDSVAMCVYIERGLYLTATLFLLYVIIVIIGFFNWRRQLQTAYA